MISELQKHQRIALDFDDTLVGHKNSPLLWDFVQNNCVSIDFHIITFRSGDWANTKILSEDMIKFSQGEIRPYMFRSVEFCPDVLHDEFQAVRLSRIQTGTMTPTLVLPEEDGFYDFKARRAEELGCTVLVDDRPEWTRDACVRRGISFIDTADLA